MVPAVDLVDEELKWSLENPHRYQKPESEWPKRSRVGRIMATKETGQRLAQILVDREILVPVDEDLIPRTESGDLILGGCFAVRKKVLCQNILRRYVDAFSVSRTTMHYRI